MGNIWSIRATTNAAVSTAAVSTAAVYTAPPTRAEGGTGLTSSARHNDRSGVLELQAPAHGRPPPVPRRALRRIPSITPLSPCNESGSVRTALPMADDILDTGPGPKIPADACASDCSCPVFAGIDRSAAGPFGVRRILAGNDNLDQGKKTPGDVFGAFEDLRVPTAVIAGTKQTPSDELHMVTSEALAALDLIGTTAPNQGTKAPLLMSIRVDFSAFGPVTTFSRRATGFEAVGGGACVGDDLGNRAGGDCQGTRTGDEDWTDILNDPDSDRLSLRETDDGDRATVIIPLEIHGGPRQPGMVDAQWPTSSATLLPADSLKSSCRPGRPTSKTAASGTMGRSLEWSDRSVNSSNNGMQSTQGGPPRLDPSHSISNPMEIKDKAAKCAEF